VRAAPQQHIKEYISDSSVGSDEDAPTTRRVTPKVATSAPRRTRRTTGKIPACWAAAIIATTQTAEAKKKKRKRTGPAVLADTATVSSGVETINIEDDAKSPRVTAVSSAGHPARRS
jgi:hypothetical protein